MKAIVCIGVPASGKTTWTAEFLVGHSSTWVEVNRDNIRFNHKKKDWTAYKFNKENERKVTEEHTRQLETAAALGLNVIVSDTNLNEKFRNELVQRLENLGYEVEFKVFHIELEEAWKRDANREGGGHDAGAATRDGGLPVRPSADGAGGELARERR